MRISSLLVSAVLLITSFSANASRDISWSVIHGWQHPEITAYIDTKSVRRDTTLDYGSGIVLFSRQQPVELVVSGKKIVTNSLARYILVDCKNDSFAPIADFYFNTANLPLADIPVAALDYSSDEPKVSAISKKNAIHKTLCQEYI